MLTTGYVSKCLNIHAAVSFITHGAMQHGGPENDVSNIRALKTTGLHGRTAFVLSVLKFGPTLSGPAVSIARR